ncbi:MAG: hypothetical protein IJS32_05465, partial [Kiritimatiellae bacterium]|nr:hypothetical protein [Kiritimatiellia bacterium]
VCQGLAITAPVCRTLANVLLFSFFTLRFPLGEAGAAAPGFAGRSIVRTPDMCDVDLVDTVIWYAQESVDLAVFPWRCGKPVEIPDGASACWIVSDEEGTNWIARYATGISSNFAAFRLDAGEGALPEEHDYTGFVTLLDGTNVLGVIDRFGVRVQWNPQDDTVPVSPPASGWPAILDWLQSGIEGFVATNAVVVSNTAAILSLEERVALLWAEVFPPVPEVLVPEMAWPGGNVSIRMEDAGLEIPTHVWNVFERATNAVPPSAVFPDGRIWKMAVPQGGSLGRTHCWRLSEATSAHPFCITNNGTIFEMTGVYADGNTDHPTHEWRQK